MRVVSGFIIREVAGEIIAIPSGDAAKKLSGVLALNGSGKVLFDLLQSEQTEQDLVQAIRDIYEIDLATAKADVAEFLGVLCSNGFLVDEGDV